MTQLDLNGDRHPCTYISKTISPTERIYKIYDQELLAIIQALEEWRHYIQSSPHTTIVLLDHKNLTYYREARKLNQRQARWSLYLSEFNVKLVHAPGHKMILSDVGQEFGTIKNIYIFLSAFFFKELDSSIKCYVCYECLSYFQSI